MGGGGWACSGSRGRGGMPHRARAGMAECAPTPCTGCSRCDTWKSPVGRMGHLPCSSVRRHGAPPQAPLDAAGGSPLGPLAAWAIPGTALAELPASNPHCPVGPDSHSAPALQQPPPEQNLEMQHWWSGLPGCSLPGQLEMLEFPAALVMGCQPGHSHPLPLQILLTPSQRPHCHHQLLAPAHGHSLPRALVLDPHPQELGTHELQRTQETGLQESRPPPEKARQSLAALS